jgi:iron complex outermembrane receptor protein
MLTTILPPWRRLLRPALSGLAALAALLTLSAADAVKINFDLPAGPAGETLKAFARQAGREIVFSADTVGGIPTKAVLGEYTPRDAIEQMLADTGLAATQDARTGAFAVRKAAGNEAKNVPSRIQTQAASRAEESGEKVVLEKFSVTGSRISRLQEAGPLPVTNYSGGDIEARGFQNTGDFMQSLSFNSGTMGSINIPSTFGVPYARGAVTINPRGMGTSRFLVLLDGKRTASYGLADTSGGAVFDFNSIPVEAVDSVEYLKDGASAIYGSDAITGVMNIKLRKNYSGISTTAMVGNTFGHDTFTRSLSVLAGGVTEKGSYMLNVNWFRQNDNLAQDYARSRTTDYTSFGPIRGQNNNSPGNFPFNVLLTAAQATAAGLTGGAGYYVIGGGQQVANPTLANFVGTGSTSTNSIPNANRYDFAPTTQLTPGQDNLSALLSLQHRFTDAVAGFARLTFTNNATDFLYTPISITSTAIITSSGGPLTIPANNPYNPFGFALTSFRGRGNGFGPTRSYAMEANGGNYQFGLDGTLSGDWTWSTSFTYGFSTVSQLTRNQVRTDDMQAALNGTLRGYVGQFFNPFGPSASRDMVNSLFVPSNGTSKSTAWGYDVSASGPLFAMPAMAGFESAGPVAIAVGGEWHQERLVNNSDPVGYLVALGDLPFAGSRTVTSGFLEVEVPVLPKYLTAQLAVRHDRYSDFGGTTNPKVALVSQVSNFLKLRTSYSESFKAPDIGVLYRPVSRTNSTTILDPLRPLDPPNMYPMQSGGNPNLKPEEARVWYGGFVLDLDRQVKGLSFSVDYFDIKITNVITTLSNALDFFTYFPELVVRGPSVGGLPGPIQYFQAIPINAATYSWKGTDFALGYRYGNKTFGNLNVDLQATYTDYFAYNAGLGGGSVDTAGRYNNPHWTGTAQLGWRKNNWGATLGMQYKGSYLNDAFKPNFVWNQGAEYLFNGTISWQGPWRTKFTLGCNNLFDTQPPPNGRAIPSNGFDVNTYSAWALGRYAYLKVKKDF